MEIYKSARKGSFNPLLNLSLRSKRFRVVSEQRMTKERRGTGFSVLAVRKMEREPKRFFFCPDYYYYFIYLDVLGSVYT